MNTVVEDAPHCGMSARLLGNVMNDQGLLAWLPLNACIHFMNQVAQ